MLGLFNKLCYWATMWLCARSQTGNLKTQVIRMLRYIEENCMVEQLREWRASGALPL